MIISSTIIVTKVKRYVTRLLRAVIGRRCTCGCECC
jgi:hypothetical protein